MGPTPVPWVFPRPLPVTSDLTTLSDAINAASHRPAWLRLCPRQGHHHAGQYRRLEHRHRELHQLRRRRCHGDSRGVAVTEGANDSIVVGGAVSFSAATNFSVSTDTGTTVLAAATVASALSSVGSLSIGTRPEATAALSVIDGALAFVSGLRATLGAVQNRLGSVVASGQATAENVSQRVRDSKTRTLRWRRPCCRKRKSCSRPYRHVVAGQSAAAERTVAVAVMRSRGIYPWAARRSGFTPTRRLRVVKWFFSRRGVCLADETGGDPVLHAKRPAVGQTNRYEPYEHRARPRFFACRPVCRRKPCMTTRARDEQKPRSSGFFFTADRTAVPRL